MNDPDLKCPECGARMTLKTNSYGLFYGCERPGCEGSHGAHRDGRPLGIPANKETRALRQAAHATFDPLWEGGDMTRSEAYAWMGQTLGLSARESHIGRFDKATCKKLIKAIWARSDETIEV